MARRQSFQSISSNDDTQEAGGEGLDDISTTHDAMDPLIRPNTATSSLKRGGIVGVVVGLCVVVGVLVLWKFFPQQGAQVASGYQAVFLTNGQVYFGKVDARRGQYVVLTDVYYLQSQPPAKKKDDAEKPEPQMSLIKLGNEVHGPTDRMEINRDHILYIEELQPNGKVMQAIEQNRKAGGAQ